MSYPDFGKKKICRGGAWCTPHTMVTPTYRNAHYPSCRKHYIGFRVVRDV